MKKIAKYTFWSPHWTSWYHDIFAICVDGIHDVPRKKRQLKTGESA